MNASPFADWQVYYTILGTSSSALIGLMFVVITLIGSRVREDRGSGDGVATFSTPTVVHFAMALLASAAMCAPWRTLNGPVVSLTLTALIGTVASIRAMGRARTMDSYEPDAEDWIWHWIAPALTYALILISAVLVLAQAPAGHYLAAVSIAALIAIGIRNSWDVVTYIAVLGESES